MKIISKLIVGALIIGASAFSVQAQSISDILGKLGSSNSGNSSGGILGSVIEGVFTRTNLTVADLVGEYNAEGPAVTFQSENFLKKAGGIAAASKMESELNPYYEKYGLNNMSLIVEEGGNFTMKIKSLSLKGVIKPGDEQGTFNFSFNVLGINLGSFKAYVEKSGKNLNIMFDATKLKNFISYIAKLTGNTMAQALGSILDSYEGACVGWKMVSTAQSEGTDIKDAVTNGISSLKDILKK